MDKDLINLQDYPNLEDILHNIKRFGMDAELQPFVGVWELDETCPIQVWCKKHPGRTIQDQIDDFIKLSKREPSVTRIQHHHISYLLSDDLRELFVNTVQTDSVQSQMMYINDATITTNQADLLYSVLSCPNSGQSEYHKQILNGEFRIPERNQLINVDSDITLSFLKSEITLENEIA